MLNFTHKRKSVSRLLAPVALAVILAGCSTPTQQQAVTADITAAVTDSAANYLIKAESNEGTESIDWHILALKALIKEGSWSQAEQQANRLGRLSLSPLQMAEWQLARATLRYQQGQPQSALDTLNFQPWWTLADSQYLRFHMLRAELLGQTNQSFKAARERTALDQYLKTEQKAANWQNLWRDLSHYNNNQLQATKLNEDETVLRGWIQLNILKNTYSQRPAKLKATVEEWLAKNQYHPANQFLPAELQAIMSLEITQLNNVALLLPLTGRYENSGKAVRDGFINAMLDDTGREADTELAIYDTEAEPVSAILSKLKQDGIELVIGPLRKEKITDFQRGNSTDITMLALNEPEQLNMTQSNACYFSLSPEQEAEQAAQHLFAKGHEYPMVLAPGNSFGERVSNAFIDQWQQLTGKSPAISSFSSRKQIQQQIATVFGLTESQARVNQMQQVLGLELESQPRSRRDTDAVYLVANKNELTLLKPFIEVAINPDIEPPKLYASSRSYPDSKEDTSELKGIEFSDIPLLVDANQNFMARYNELWPNAKNTDVRLHAFGMDAYKMIAELPQMRVVDNYTTPGKTGQLSINDQCVIQRQISWAIFSGNGIEPVQ
ncbi:penicillin-binding protein activator [Photobacterium chitinilyticum]|uniref:Penicillin-binding protein activator LpoA n=1 Tax=Photobacterium chitinilyticum TaxID=2485123 RepID=A0A3S3QZ84_9GAMM|nr:penicillin-binding protein activator [Photobacterium chitinilyticum]RWX53895.1 YraN family protein [Photobacterium chitinilyticum]